MAEVKFKKGSEEFQFFTDFWRFVQKYYIPEKSDAYWDDMTIEANGLFNRYNGGLYRKMIVAFIDYQEEKSREIP